MPVKKSHEQFVREMSVANPDIEVIGTYINHTTPIMVKCRACGHEWLKPPSKLLIGIGCKECAKRKQVKKHSQFVDEMKVKNPEIEIIGEYKTSKDPIKVKCKKCNYQWEPYPSNILYHKEGCPNCARNAKKNNDQFIDELYKKQPNIIVLEQYHGYNKPIKVKCTVCGNVWTAKPSNLLNYRGCKKCGIKQAAKTKTRSKEWFLDKLKQSNPDIQLVGEYNNLETKTDVKCKKCGHIWPVEPGCLIRKNKTGCPKCAGNIKTHEDFIKEIETINPEIEILGKYSNGKKGIKVRCKKCNHVWSPVPGSLLAGRGCPKCNHVPTSFMEQFILLSLITALGDGKVIHRNTDAIGAELDIYIPTWKLAIEPGSWYWHKDKIERDKRKQELCSVSCIMPKT